MAEAEQPAPEPVPESPVARFIAEFGHVPGVTAVGMERDEVVLHAERDALLGVMTALRDEFGFEQVMDICGVDFPDRDERFDIVYNLLSICKNRRLRVIVTADESRPVPSVCSLWPCATWWERETWDLYGVTFSGQPDLRRILTDYGFEGHPLRKDFPLTGHVEVRYDEERKQVVYEPVKLPQDWRSFDFISPWEGVTTLPGDEKVHQERTQVTRTPPAPVPGRGEGA